MLTPEQKKARLNYIGGSDAAAVLGLSRWGTPLQVWAEKTGQIVRDGADTLQQRLGHKLEPMVAELFTEETGKQVEVVPETLFHPVHPFLACNLDRRVVGERAILQCKTVTPWKAQEWEGEEIPREYIIQEMHELAVSGMDRAYIAVLIGNQDFKWKKIERAEVQDAIDIMVVSEVAFWTDYVLTKKMPTHITARDTDTLEALFPVGREGSVLKLSDQANAIAESLESMATDAKALKSQIEKAQNELMAMLGAYEKGTTGRWEFTWINTGPRRFQGKKFKAAHPALYEQFREKVPGRQFKIKSVSLEETDHGNPE